MRFKVMKVMRRWGPLAAVHGALFGLTFLGGEPVSSQSQLLWDRISRGKPLVLMFHSVECPISDRYVPAIKRLNAEFGVEMSLYVVFPNSHEDDAAVDRYLSNNDLAVPSLRDAQGELVEWAGVQVTPEVAVFLPGEPRPELVYRGRYDDRYTALGQSRPAATVHFLEALLEEIRSGERPEFADTKAVGCYIFNEGAKAGSVEEAEGDQRRQ